MKLCLTCERELPLTEFWKRTASADGLQTYCKDCQRSRIRASERKYRQDARAKKDAKLRRKYGITIEQYDELVAAQGGGCAVCGNTERALNVDHCHETGLVRGLLCFHCNTGIGKLGDTIDGLERAIDYLRAVA